MALAIGALTGVLGTLFGSKGKEQEAKVKQEILNNINVSTISQALVKQVGESKINTTEVNQASIDVGLGCHAHGAVGIEQSIKVKVYNANSMASNLSQSTVQDLQSQINNQLESSIEQVNKKLIDLFPSGQSAKIDNDMKNILSATVKSTFTLDNIQKASTIVNVSNSGVFSCGCIQSLPNYAVCAEYIKDAPVNVDEDIKITQTVAIDLVLTNLINSALQQISNNQAATNWANKGLGKAGQTETDFLSEIVDAIKDIFSKFGWLLIIAGVVVLIIIILVVVYMFKKHGSGQMPMMPMPMMQPQMGMPPQMGMQPQQMESMLPEMEAMAPEMMML